MWRFHVPSFDKTMSPLPWDWPIANKSDHINFRRRLAWKGPMWSGANSYVILILALPAMYALLVGFKYYWIFKTYILRSDSAVCSNNYFALYGNFYVASQRLYLLFPSTTNSATAIWNMHQNRIPNPHRLWHFRSTWCTTGSDSTK